MSFDSKNYISDVHALASQKQSGKNQAKTMRQVMSIFARRHFTPYKVLVNRPRRTVVILNPKVGTTTFRDIACRACVEVLGMKDASDGRYKLIRKARQFPIASLRDYYHVFSHPGHYDFYCFVRNPYARLKSAWVDKFANGHQTGYPRSIRGKVLRHIRQFAASRHLPGSEPDSLVPFSTFVSYIDAQEDGKRNHHWDVQHSVLMMDCIHYASIFKMETQFTEGMTAVFTRLGVPENWLQQAMQKPSNQSRKVKEAVFTPELAKQTERIYARDFQIFGYDVDSWKGL